MSISVGMLFLVWGGMCLGGLLMVLIRSGDGAGEQLRSCFDYGSALLCVYLVANFLPK